MVDATFKRKDAVANGSLDFLREKIYNERELEVADALFNQVLWAT